MDLPSGDNALSDFVVLPLLTGALTRDVARGVRTTARAGPPLLLLDGDGSGVALILRVGSPRDRRMGRVAAAKELGSAAAVVVVGLAAASPVELLRRRVETPPAM